MKWTLMALLILAIFALTACTAPLLTEPDSLGMPNPASKHCEDEGYTLEIRSEEGGDIGYCVFDDGSECEEWAFFRDECTPGQ